MRCAARRAPGSTRNPNTTSGPPSITPSAIAPPSRKKSSASARTGSRPIVRANSGSKEASRISRRNRKNSANGDQRRHHDHGEIRVADREQLAAQQVRHLDVARGIERDEQHRSPPRLIANSAPTPHSAGSCPRRCRPATSRPRRAERGRERADQRDRCVRGARLSERGPVSQKTAAIAGGARLRQRNADQHQPAQHQVDAEQAHSSATTSPPSDGVAEQEVRGRRSRSRRPSSVHAAVRDASMRSTRPTHGVDVMRHHPDRQPRAACAARASSSRIAFSASGSTPAVGSSSSSSSRAAWRARAPAVSRWRWPPESAP